MNNEKKIIIFTSVSHFLFHFYEIAFPALAIPLVLSLNMELKDVLQLGFPMYLMFGLLALPWGLFSDHFSNRLGLAICFIGGAAGALMTAFSSTPSAISISLAAIGFFACISHPAGMGLISHSTKKVGTSLGIFSVAGSVGLVIGPFLAAFLNWLAGWQFAFLAAGIFSLGWGVAKLFTKIDETPVHHEEAETEAKLQAGNNGAHPPGRLLLFFFIVTLGGLAYRINIVALPAYLELQAGFLSEYIESLGIHNLAGTATLAAAALTSIVYLSGIIGQFISGKIADRRELRSLYFIFNAASLPFILMMAFFTDLWLVLASAAYVFFALGLQPIENSLIAKFTPRRWRSTGYGFAMILIFGVGALAVFVVGWVSQNWGLGSAYLVSAGLITVIVLCIVLLISMTRGISFHNIPKEKTRDVPGSF
jgi:MFS family permease